jgi:hypothetical protein
MGPSGGCCEQAIERIENFGSRKGLEFFYDWATVGFPKNLAP